MIAVEPSILFAPLRAGPRGQFARYGEAKGSFAQVTQFIAVVHGIKPSMDDWVPVDQLETYLHMLEHFGLHAEVDAYFVPIETKDLLGISGASTLNTTRARAFPVFDRPKQGEAHIFLSKEHSLLEQAVASGWYNLVVRDQVIHKPLIDHFRFGEALGYPECCVAFFFETNDWFSGNSYYQAFRATPTTPHYLCNSLPKRTPASYIVHIPHSFSCTASMRLAESIRDAIGAEDADFQRQVDNILNLPCLCLTELEMFIFDGELANETELRYRSVNPLPPTTSEHPLYTILREGDQLVIDANLLHVYRSGKFVGVYEARGDALGPQVPFIITCSGSI